jgi:hypothetical protein
VQDDLTYTEYLVKILEYWRESPGVRGFRCVRFNGVTMQRMRLHGNEITSYRQNFPSSLLAQLNLKDEIPLQGGRFVTP